jgi:hypothetical protein
LIFCSLFVFWQVSYNSGVKRFTVHAYPTKKSLFGKTRRVQKDFCFIASSLDEAILWVTCFAEQNIYVHLLPHPATSSIKQDSDAPLSESLFDQPPIKCKSPQRVLVILNPRSGHGRSSKVFHEKAEPVFKVPFDVCIMQKCKELVFQVSMSNYLLVEFLETLFLPIMLFLFA